MICLGADALRHPAFLLGEQALRLGSATRRVSQRGAVGLDLAPESELLLAQRRGFGLERLGIPTALGLLLDLRTDQAKAFRSERRGAEEALTQRGEREPRLLRCREHGRSRLGFSIESGLLSRECGELSLDFQTSLAQRRLISHLRRQSLAELREVISHETQTGVAGLSLDDCGTPSDLGLAP